MVACFHARVYRWRLEDNVLSESHDLVAIEYPIVGYPLRSTAQFAAFFERLTSVAKVTLGLASEGRRDGMLPCLDLSMAS